MSRFLQIDHKRHSPISAQHHQPGPNARASYSHQYPAARAYVSAACLANKRTRKPEAAYLGIRTANRETARSRSTQAIVFRDCSLCRWIAMGATAEADIGARPTAGNGLAVWMAYGRSRAKSRRKDRTVTTRSRPCFCLLCGGGCERAMGICIE